MKSSDELLSLVPEIKCGRLQRKTLIHMKACTFEVTWRSKMTRRRLPMPRIRLRKLTPRRIRSGPQRLEERARRRRKMTLRSRVARARAARRLLSHPQGPPYLVDVAEVRRRGELRRRRRQGREVVRASRRRGDTPQRCQKAPCRQESTSHPAILPSISCCLQTTSTSRCYHFSENSD